MPARFVTMKQVAEELSLRRGAGLRPGAEQGPARGEDRWPRPVAHRTDPPLEEWIERLYRGTERFIDEHPFTGAGDNRTVDNRLSDPPPEVPTS